jgi:hypothetical protein
MALQNAFDDILSSKGGQVYVWLFMRIELILIKDEVKTWKNKDLM